MSLFPTGERHDAAGARANRPRVAQPGTPRVELPRRCGLGRRHPEAEALEEEADTSAKAAAGQPETTKDVLGWRTSWRRYQPEKPSRAKTLARLLRRSRIFDDSAEGIPEAHRTAVGRTEEQKAAAEAGQKEKAALRRRVAKAEREQARA